MCGGVHAVMPCVCVVYAVSVCVVWGHVWGHVWEGCMPCVWGVCTHAMSVCVCVCVCVCCVCVCVAVCVWCVVCGEGVCRPCGVCVSA